MKRSEINNYYLSSISNLLYATAIDDSPSRKFHFIQTGKNNSSANNHFSEQASIGLAICRELGIEFESYDWEAIDCIKLEDIESNDFIDIRLYMERRLRNKPKFLGLNPEYLSVSIPSIFTLNRLQLKLRIEQIIRIFLPKRILVYHSIDTKEHRGTFFRSQSINREMLTSNLKKLHSLVPTRLSESDFLLFTSLKEAQRVAIIFPLLPQFGGDEEYHRRMFADIQLELDTNNVNQVLIKNHPSDSRDFTPLGEECFGSKYLHFSHETLTSLPVEIILAEINFDLYGTFSTTMLGLNHLSRYSAKLYLPHANPWKNFLTYAQSSQYALINHRLKYI